MINVKEKKTERTEKIGKGQTAPKRKKTATVERIAQAIGSKRFLAIVLCCCAWAVFHAVNMYAVYSDLLKRVRDALPIYSGEEMQRFAELTSDLIYTFRVTAGIYCILECILPIAAAAAFAAVHCDARRGQLAEGSGIPLLRMTLAVQVVIGIAAAVTLCLLVVCAAELEQDIIVFRKTVLNIIATPPPVFTPMRIAAIIITAGGIDAALCTLECFLFRMFGNVRSQLSAEPNGGRAEIRLQRAEYLLFGLGLASAACAVVLLAAVVAMGQRHPSVYKSGIINAFNPPAFAAAACALFTGMKLCRSCEQQGKNCCGRCTQLTAAANPFITTKKQSRCGELCFLLFLREESRKVAFAKTVCLTAFFTKHETLTQPTAEGTVIFRPLNRRIRRTRP